MRRGSYNCSFLVFALRILLPSWRIQSKPRALILGKSMVHHQYLR